MPKTTESVIFSDAEREILERALQNPELSNSDIAEQTGYRLTLIRDTRRQYEDDVTLPEGVAEETTKDTTADVAAALNETEQQILDLVAANPRITNAEIADETGARVALVRDTRDAYGDQIETNAVDEDDGDSDTTPSGPGEPSAAQQEILDVAADDPTLSNAEIAEQTGSRITLVRDTLDQYDGPSDTGGETAAIDTEIDTEGYSEAQIEILEAAAANPAATNRELADKTGSRVTLVRDTLASQAADDDESTTETTTTDDGSSVLDDVDTDAFSGTQLRILEIALSNPELTNAEIADQTDTRITLVRDTIYEHEYDEKPWVGNVEETADEANDEDDDDEIVVESDDEIEIPETTASDVFNDRQRAILEAALENPELTNGEIADKTGARLTLVRDTRSTYEDGVKLATDDSEEPTSTQSTAAPTFSEKQKTIIAAADGNEELSIAEIAAQTDSRIPLVRDTLAAADGDVDGVTSDESDSSADSVETSAADEVSTADESATEDGSASVDTSTQPEADGVSSKAIIAIVVGILLLVGIAVLLS